MRKFKKRLKYAWGMFYTLNHYWGVESLTFWDYIFAKRVGISTSWALAKNVYP